MDTVNIHQAKTYLSKLLSRVELGEEIIITNEGLPVARLVPIILPTDYTNANKIDRRISMGIDRGLFQVPDDFNAPLNISHRSN
jgi:prevent-host-death family protein